MQLKLTTLWNFFRLTTVYTHLKSPRWSTKLFNLPPSPGCHQLRNIVSHSVSTSVTSVFVNLLSVIKLVVYCVHGHSVGCHVLQLVLRLQESVWSVRLCHPTEISRSDHSRRCVPSNCPACINCTGFKHGKVSCNSVVDKWTESIYLVSSTNTSDIFLGNGK